MINIDLKHIDPNQSYYKIVTDFDHFIKFVNQQPSNQNYVLATTLKTKIGIDFLKNPLFTGFLNAKHWQIAINDHDFPENQTIKTALDHLNRQFFDQLIDDPNQIELTSKDAYHHQLTTKTPFRSYRQAQILEHAIQYYHSNLWYRQTDLKTLNQPNGHLLETMTYQALQKDIQTANTNTASIIEFFECH